MYKPIDKLQHTFLDFNQPMGLKMDPNNRWIKMADSIPWDVFEEKYAKLFPSSTGDVAKPLRLALGTLIIQTKYQYAYREQVAQLTENLYYQYFIGLPGYQQALFKRTAVRGMIQKDRKFLLIHSKYVDHKFPGGGIKKGESLEQTLLREVQEETGYLVKKESISEGIIVHEKRKGDPDDLLEMDSYYFFL